MEMFMKNVLLLLSLLSLPVVGMEKFNACMLYCKPTKHDTQTAVIQGGLITAQIASCHPTIKAIINDATQKALPVSFVVPALVAWNSEAIKNTIMDQLPELNSAASYCLGSGIQKSLFYGGSALTAYLFYTQTWNGLTKNSLVNIFKPQIEQGKRVRSLARISKQNAADINNRVVEFGKQIEQNKQAQLELEKAASLDHAKLSSITEKLKKSEQNYKILLKQLDLIIKELNVAELNNQINAIEQRQLAHNEKSQMRLQDTHGQIDLYQTKMVNQLQVKDNELSQRFKALTILSSALDEDMAELINRTAFLAKVIDESRFRTHKMLESVHRLSKAVTESAILADNGSDSEYATDDDESDSEITFPRGAGGSRAKSQGK
jgi:hypothetical protein